MQLMQYKRFIRPAGAPGIFLPSLIHAVNTDITPIHLADRR